MRTAGGLSYGRLKGPSWKSPSAPMGAWKDPHRMAINDNNNNKESIQNKHTLYGRKRKEEKGKQREPLKRERSRVAGSISVMVFEPMLYLLVL